MMENKAFKVAGIRNLLTRNYKFDSDSFDLEALVDDNITMSENWFNTIKPMIWPLIGYENIYKYNY